VQNNVKKIDETLKVAMDTDYSKYSAPWIKLILALKRIPYDSKINI
jgi:hypothetical protein